MISAKRNGANTAREKSRTTKTTEAISTSTHLTFSPQQEKARLVIQKRISATHASGSTTGLRPTIITPSGPTAIRASTVRSISRQSMGGIRGSTTPTNWRSGRAGEGFEDQPCRRTSGPVEQGRGSRTNHTDELADSPMLHFPVKHGRDSRTNHADELADSQVNHFPGAIRGPNTPRDWQTPLQLQWSSTLR